MEIKKHYASLSEAIRDGARLRPQAFGSYFKNGGSCAFGAGYEAITGVEGNWVQSDLSEMFAYLHADAPCPACLFDCPTIDAVIPHLNDHHQWTREAIADWLYAEEEKLGFVTVIETEASELKMIAEPSTVNAAAHFSALTKF